MLNDSVVKKETTFAEKVKAYAVENIVTLIFIVICLIGAYYSGFGGPQILQEIIVRLGRNGFLVLALIIPILAGMGLNFGIVIGAMAGQIAIIAVAHWANGGNPMFTGFTGFLITVLLSTPLAILFGWMSGVMMNKTKGQEMITSLIMGFFANGVYQFIFLFLCGTMIPIKDPIIMLASGVGVKNTIDLTSNIKYSLDHSLNWLEQFGVYFYLFNVLSMFFAVVLIVSLVRVFKARKKSGVWNRSAAIWAGVSVAVIAYSAVASSSSAYKMINVPVPTILVIAALCIFNVAIMKTKLGQEFRTIGQDMHIAKVAGLDVNNLRVKAIIISIVLAAWGQIVFLQNLGTLNTYGSHESIAMFSAAALLVGGASVTKATWQQALLGVVLFHTLFYVSPYAGKNLLGDTQVGEFFRVFVAYGVICLSLALYAWKKFMEKSREVK